MLLTKIFFSQKEVKDDRLACLKNNQYGGGWYTFQFPKLVHFYIPIDIITLIEVNMNYFQVLGINKNMKSLICVGIISLMLLGLATNGLFDLSHVFDNGDFDPYNVRFWINIGYVIAFICWIGLLRHVSSKKPSRISPSIQVAEPGRPYKGIVLILSKPQNTTPKEINDTIEKAFINQTAEDPIELYNIRSIGQLFKGIYKHRANLKYVWPIVTEDSKPFRECIDTFIKRYCSNVRLTDSKENRKDYCLLPKSNEGTDMINNVKMAVSAIYSEDNLNPLELKKQDIIMDMSGGTKTMTIGAVFGAIDKEIDIQYVEQTSNQLISVSITPENILDKLAEYLLGIPKDTKTEQRRSIADHK